MTNRTLQTSPLYLGVDTGGTYTDAVLWSEANGIVAKAKSLTTRHDLAEGIAGAVDAVLHQAAIHPSAIKLVSMSTTLATNALVEGQGGRVALVMVGFTPADLVPPSQHIDPVRRTFGTLQDRQAARDHVLQEVRHATVMLLLLVKPTSAARTHLWRQRDR